MKAADKGHLEITTYLLDNEADINLVSSVEGKTTLMKAAKNGHAAVVELLLMRGAETDTRDKVLLFLYSFKTLAIALTSHCYILQI